MLSKTFRAAELPRASRRKADDKILVVDPDGRQLEAVAAALRAGGFRVVTLARYEGTIPLFTVFRPHAVVLGARAPEEQVVAAARRIRQHSHGTVPIVYVLDDATAEARTFCLSKGMAVDVLGREADGRELLASLRAQLRLARAVARTARLEHEAPTSALHDALTGAYTRGYLLALVAHETHRCARHGGVFSILGCEVQGVAEVRRALGEEMAQRLLVYASVVLSQTVRESDVVARTGEHEFAVLLPGTPEESVAALLSRVKARFALARVQIAGKALGAHVALGAASFPDRVGTAGKLVEAAFEDLRNA